MSSDAALPLVSVIIPSFNSAEFLSQAIDSALETTVAVEVIVVDDGSTDSTPQVLAAYEGRVLTLHQQRGGPYRARNLAASHSRGQWLAFLDADDLWLPGKLERQLELGTQDVDLVYTDRLNFGDLRRVKERQSDAVTLWDGDVFERLLMGNFITLSSVMLRKRAFDDLGGFETSRTGVQDWDMWLRFSGSGRRVALCREALTKYRFHDKQMTNELARRAADREEVLRRALESPRGLELPPATVRRALSQLWLLAGWQAGPIDRAESIRSYLRAARFDPFNFAIYRGAVNAALGRL
jgi:glycosyltransferase involved in cell wall biosynthesis